jgi:hypothetical protein
MMLLVERHLAAAVRLVRRARRAGARAPAQVDDLGGRCEQHAAPARADGRAEVDVLGVEEVPLVEQPDRSASTRRTSSAAPLTQSTSRSARDSRSTWRAAHPAPAS